MTIRASLYNFTDADVPIPSIDLTEEDAKAIEADPTLGDCYAIGFEDVDGKLVRVGIVNVRKSGYHFYSTNEHLISGVFPTREEVRDTIQSWWTAYRNEEEWHH